MTRLVQGSQPAHGSGTIVIAVGGGGSCDEASIDTAADEGSLITTMSGIEYHVMGGDESTSETWLSADDILVCGDKIIDKSENGETVEIE